MNNPTQESRHFHLHLDIRTDIAIPGCLRGITGSFFIRRRHDDKLCKNENVNILKNTRFSVSKSIKVYMKKPTNLFFLTKIVLRSIHNIL